MPSKLAMPKNAEAHSTQRHARYPATETCPAFARPYAVNPSTSAVTLPTSDMSGEGEPAKGCGVDR